MSAGEYQQKPAADLPAAASAVLADVVSELHEAVAQGQVDTAEGYAADVAAHLQRVYGVTAPTGTPDPNYCPDCGAHADNGHAAGCKLDPFAHNAECRWCTARAQGVAIAPTEQAVPSCGAPGHGNRFTRAGGPWLTQQPSGPKFAPRYDPQEP